MVVSLYRSDCSHLLFVSALAYACSLPIPVLSRIIPERPVFGGMCVSGKKLRLVQRAAASVSQDQARVVCLAQDVSEHEHEDCRGSY